MSDRKGREGADLPGMNELYHILCDMRCVIKKVSEAQPLKGAKRWVDQRADGYTAKDIDLNRDDINEIVVYDPYGKAIMINGYTTKDSQ